MHIFKEIKALRAFLKEKKARHQTVGLVPTMGALHQGHLALIEASKKANSITVCSIFVNPAQFNNQADLDKYPRTPERDITMLEGAGCDVVFIPEMQEVYTTPGRIKFDFGRLDKILEGEFRPGHFSGVGLIVSKLFNIVQPTRAYFGQKDFQQFRIVSQLVAELNFDLELVCAPTTREADGLALSSRNARLSADGRKQAQVLSQALFFACESVRHRKSLADIKATVKNMADAAGVRLEYFELADRENLNLLESVNVSVPSIFLIAGYVGEVRLIDNMLVED